MVRRRAIAPPQRHPAIVKAEFAEMLEAAHANGWAEELNCYDKPELWSDYEEIPPANVVDKMCDGCPMLELCREFGDATRPSWGVLGGKAWVYGRSAHWAGNLKGNNDTDLDGFFDPAYEWPIDWRAREAALRTEPDPEAA